jgi:hypothetical protein
MSRSQALSDVFIATCLSIAMFLAADLYESRQLKHRLDYKPAREFSERLVPRVIIK